MRRYHPFIAFALSALMTCPAGFAQASGISSDAGVRTSYSDKPQVPVASGSFLSRNYQRPVIAPINMQNSPRLDSLIRAGMIYLSLEEAIALALENNIDIEVARYGPQIAQSDYLRAKAGGLLRGVPSAVTAVANSATSQSGSGSGQTGTGSSTASAGVGSSTGADWYGHPESRSQLLLRRRLRPHLITPDKHHNHWTFLDRLRLQKLSERHPAIVPDRFDRESRLYSDPRGG